MKFPLSVFTILLAFSCAPSQTASIPSKGTAPLPDCSNQSGTIIFAGLYFGLNKECVTSELKRRSFSYESSYKYTTGASIDGFSGQLYGEPISLVIYYLSSGEINAVDVFSRSALLDERIKPTFDSAKTELERKYGTGKRGFLYDVLSENSDKFFQENAEALAGLSWNKQDMNINLDFLKLDINKAIYGKGFSLVIIYNSKNFDSSIYKDYNL